MGELTTISYYRDKVNDMSPLKLGDAILLQGEAWLQEFDRRFPLNGSWTEEQVAYIKKCRNQFKREARSHVTNILRYRCRWASFQEDVRTTDAHAFKQYREKEYSIMQDWPVRMKRIIRKTASYVGSMTSTEVALEQIRKNGLQSDQTIAADDPLVLEKLSAKAEYHDTQRRHMLAFNSYYHLFKSMKGFWRLSDSEAESIDAYLKESGKMPFSETEMRKHTTSMEAALKRIELIRRAHPKKSMERDYGNIRIIESLEWGCLQLVLPEPPEKEIMNLLQRSGFWPDRYGKLWSRQLTDSALYTTKCILPMIAASEGEGQEYLPESPAEWGV